MFTVEMLHANEGDALWIEYSADPVRRILIDCGRKTAYRAVAERLAADPSINFELFVLTHVDADHIAGAVPLLGDEPKFGPDKVKDVWFNGWEHLNARHKTGHDVPDTLSAKQGEYFSALLTTKGYPWNNAFEGMPVVIPDTGPLPRIELDGDMVITLLGPTAEKLSDMKERWEGELSAVPGDFEPGDIERALELLGEDKGHLPDLLSGGPDGPIDIPALQAAPFVADKSEPNGSSIAFLAEHNGRSILFAGDAHAPQLSAAIRRLLQERGQQTLSLDALKMSHHGSARNNSMELLELIDCTRYFISTNGSRHHHPDREALARVLKLYDDGVEFYFNFLSEETEPWDDEALKDEFGYSAHYVADKRICV